MATTTTPAPSTTTSGRGVQPLRAGQGNSFLWHKLHSLSGIVPIGAFLVEHILSNFETVHGPTAYAKQVLFLNSLPLVRVLEWGLIFIPLAFHALYGVFIAFRGRSNVNAYPWAGNRMYVMQRVTGIIAFLYIIQHVWRQRFMGVSLPEHPGAAFAKVQHELANPWMLAIYVIAMIATTWHFAYGIWLFAAKWGITPGDKARKRFGYVCAVVGLALCVMGLASIYAVVTAPPAPEDALPAAHAALTLQRSPVGNQSVVRLAAPTLCS
ncbi:MAG: succinate dehydrogenase [Acidobacteriota bacterium]|nr:succinate dehydrogenase [Acidobacteriota bacterium]